MDIRNNLLAIGYITLLRTVVESPSLETFKNRLDRDGLGIVAPFGPEWLVNVQGSGDVPDGSLN